MTCENPIGNLTEPPSPCGTCPPCLEEKASTPEFEREFDASFTPPPDPMDLPQWTCPTCRQLNAGWVRECGRCETENPHPRKQLTSTQAAIQNISVDGFDAVPATPAQEILIRDEVIKSLQTEIEGLRGALEATPPREFMREWEAWCNGPISLQQVRMPGSVSEPNENIKIVQRWITGVMEGAHQAALAGEKP